MAAPPTATLESSALQELTARGYFEQASDLEALDNSFANGMVTVYVGYDPTADSLHIGHLLTIMALRVLQRHGHRPLCLLGGGTALVGDPSGRTETRRLLDRETIAHNGRAFQRQIANFLHFDRDVQNDALMLDNADWLLGLGYLTFLRDIGRHFTVNRMIAAKTYRERLEAEQPLSFLEFNYQLLQAYDFMHLHREFACTLQLGGADQWGNMIAGVELIRRMAAHERDSDGERDTVQCLTLPLLTTPDGRKMGKTERGALWLDAGRVSPFDYYQYWINCNDEMVEQFLRLFTEVPLPEIAELTRAEGAALREAKRRLAFEATTLLHGAQAAENAEIASKQAFGGGDDWSAVTCVEVSGPEIKLIDLVVHEQLAAFRSKRDARQRIESGAVRLDGEPCTDPNHVVSSADCGDTGLRVQAGKRTRFRVMMSA